MRKTGLGGRSGPGHRLPPQGQPGESPDNPTPLPPLPFSLGCPFPEEFRACPDRSQTQLDISGVRAGTEGSGSPSVTQPLQRAARGERDCWLRRLTWRQLREGLLGSHGPPPAAGTGPLRSHFAFLLKPSGVDRRALCHHHSKGCIGDGAPRHVPTGGRQSDSRALDQAALTAPPPAAVPARRPSEHCADTTPGPRACLRQRLT